jgi:23S rRNA (adenine2503-C2)-methyltransferase
MVHLQEVVPETLRAAVPVLSIEEARKIVGAIHRLDVLPTAVRMVRRSSLDAVRACGILSRLEMRSVQASHVDPFVKYALVTGDGHVVETVRIPLERAGRFSVCISSQVGCAFACAFCATGTLGLRRNLEAWEIVEQVRTVRRDLDVAQRQRVHGIVFQGMGEPLANADNVIRAIRVLCEPCALAIDGRTVTVCTAGVPQGILRLAREVPKARLGISIGSAREEVRRRLMPIDRAHPLAAVLEAAADHARATGLAPMWAVTPLAGVNDTEEDAHALIECARRFLDQTGLRPQIRIISYNPIGAPETERFLRSGDARESRFQEILRAAGVSAHKRYSGGADVQAACGQLAARGGTEA